MSNVKDLSGRRFGRLVAVQRVGTNSHGNAVWHCECDCGGFKKVSAGPLVGGATRSCGCLFRDTRRTSGSGDPRMKGYPGF